jgi:hypothetical protein
MNLAIAAMNEINPAREPVPSVVYYIQFCCMVKIGFSTNLPGRLEVLPHHKVLATEDGGYVLEQKRHKQFEELRDVGEWFHYGPALKSHVKTLQGQAPILVDTEAAAFHAGREESIIYRWASEGRLTRYGGRGRGGSKWDLREIPQWSGPGSGKPQPGPPKKK